MGPWCSDGRFWLGAVAWGAALAVGAMPGAALGRPEAAPVVAAAASADAAMSTQTAAPAPAPAASTSLLPVASFFQRPAVLDAQLSPSGRWLALSTAQGGAHVGLALVDLQAPQLKMRWLAQYSDADVQRFQWVGEERLIYSVRDLNAGSGADALSGPGLFAIKVDGSEFRMLVRRDTSPRPRGTDDTPALSWNHVLLSVPSATTSENPAGQGGHSAPAPEEIILGRMVFDRGDLVQLQPLWINVRTGATRAMALPPVPGLALAWWFDAQGRPRALRSRVEGREQLWAWSVTAGAWQPLAQSADTAGALPWLPLWADASGRLWLSERRGREGLTVVSRYDFLARQPSAEPLWQADGFDLQAEPVRDAASGELLGLRATAERELTRWLSPALQAVQAAVDAQLPGHVNRLSCSRCGSAEQVVLIHSYSDQDPGSLWLMRGAETRPRRLIERLPGVRAAPMASVRLQRIRARDGRDLPVWLTIPPASAASAGAAPRPAVVLVHGGPWLRGGRWEWEALTQFLASRGYLVIAPDFRGSAGYGAAHEAAGFKQWGQAMQDDLDDALVWAQAQGLASEQACIMGGSYGGYAALMALTRRPERYRCAIAWAAPSDLELMLQGAWWVDDDTTGQGRQWLLPQRVGDVQRERERIRAQSPVRRAAEMQAPLLLLHGDQDRRVPLAHAERLREALQRAGHAPEWVVYPGEGHGFRQMAHQLDFARRVQDFLARHVPIGGAAAESAEPLASPPAAHGAP